MSRACLRQTENAVVKRLRTGLWETMSALGRVQRRYADPVGSTDRVLGIVNDGDTAAMVTLRIRVTRGDDRRHQ